MTGDELRTAFSLANAFKEGDLTVGGTTDDLVRAEAREALQATTAGDIRRTVFVDDGVTATLERGRNRSHDTSLDPLTIAHIKATLLGPGVSDWARAHTDALPSEVIAAVAKVMTDEELGTVSRLLFHPLPGPDVTIGAPQHFGSRIQPNSPGDDEEEILVSILEGLSHGCGDVIIGLNPAADELDTIVRLEQLLERVVDRLALPTRFCVLSDIVKQHQAQARTRVDVGFQSLAGTSKALRGMVGLDADGVLDLARSFQGLYFETGQGSAVTNGDAEGVDMVTLESRAYGMARHIRQQTGTWTIVNDVAGFIGPEVFRTSAQLERACLEDLVMAKLHGLTMGLDVCATFHMGIPPAELRGVTERIVDQGAPAYLMAVAGNADPMLGYLTTAYRDHPDLRRRVGRQATSAMRERFEQLPRDVEGLFGIYANKPMPATARQRLSELRERERRLDEIYTHARRALFATIDAGVLQNVCPAHVRVHTRAMDRDDYLSHPPAGERLDPRDLARVRALYPARHPQVQLVISDGLNANAVNEQLRALVSPLRRMLAEAGCHVGNTEVVVQNGRVRAGYEIGGAVGAGVIVHILGERPGTGLNTLSAYLTYGLDAAGHSQWKVSLDHSRTNAVCGIHPRGKAPEAAAAEIARTVRRILEQRRSGVSLD